MPCAKNTEIGSSLLKLFKIKLVIFFSETRFSARIFVEFVHCSSMGESEVSHFVQLNLHLVQRGWDRVRCQPAAVHWRPRASPNLVCTLDLRSEVRSKKAHSLYGALSHEARVRPILSCVETTLTVFNRIKRIRMRKKMRPMWCVIDIQALSYSTVKINLVLLLFCNLWFTGNRLTTNTDEMYQSLNQSTRFAYRPTKYGEQCSTM